MEKGVLEIDVPYGDENFKVKWLSIKEIHTESKFVVSIEDKLYQGRIASIADQRIKVFDNDSIYTTCALQDIVYLNPFKEGFANRFNAAIEVGFNLTKAQDLRQFSLRSSMSYKTDKWTADIAYNILRSSQDNVEPVNRSDGLLNYRRILLKNWYLIGTVATLSNTEQLLDLRANSQLGIGKFIVSSNRAYWGVKAGFNNNLERFTNETTNRNTWEGYLGSELNLYDTGNLELALVFMGYSGLTETGRYRADITFDTKYELPLDLFIRLGVSLNYDNRPAQNASETDYIVRTGIGWEW
ncbi:DUF481 domain-containing protein [Muricauda sp. SCSIO 64092]|uniref:DUF481 domain-containing protein n=1 Tax=Allomuricauda sp. SCSIO 64092 TaxID=2908842 RepID=UPI001FF4720A|nr:DUF481 domain-containing protein [Muricauda sp. SCSIO 64092]UOY05473.1 DUF481 domain-containing protein [Muricauda sp. SCSIO 64092]